MPLSVGVLCVLALCVSCGQEEPMSGPVGGVSAEYDAGGKTTVVPFNRQLVVAIRTKDLRTYKMEIRKKQYTVDLGACMPVRALERDGTMYLLLQTIYGHFKDMPGDKFLILKLAKEGKEHEFLGKSAVETPWAVDLWFKEAPLARQYRRSIAHGLTKAGRIEEAKKHLVESIRKDPALARAYDLDGYWLNDFHTYELPPDLWTKGVTGLDLDYHRALLVAGAYADAPRRPDTARSRVEQWKRSRGRCMASFSPWDEEEKKP